MMPLMRSNIAIAGSLPRESECGDDDSRPISSAILRRCCYSCYMYGHSDFNDYRDTWDKVRKISEKLSRMTDLKG